PPRGLPGPAVAPGRTAPGCEQADEPSRKGRAKAQPPGPTKQVEIGKNVFLEIGADKKRRVLVKAEVCRREDQLEQLLCRKGTKEHEAILAADCDARKIHAALILAGAEHGHPVKFIEDGKDVKVVPPTGTTVKIFLQFKEKGKTVTIPAQRWIRNLKTKKELHTDWVFAGSVFIKNFDDPKAEPFYGANHGDVICVANFDTAMLDLPVLSSKANDELVFEAWTD